MEDEDTAGPGLGASELTKDTKKKTKTKDTKKKTNTNTRRKLLTLVFVCRVQSWLKKLF